MEKEMQEDSVKVSSFGKIEFGFRNGWTEIIAVNEIKSVKPRTEGGSNVRLMSDRVLLTSVPIQDVAAALREADGRMYATS
jgi:hypothetical protein